MSSEAQSHSGAHQGVFGDAEGERFSPCWERELLLEVFVLFFFGGGEAFFKGLIEICWALCLEFCSITFLRRFFSIGVKGAALKEALFVFLC